MANRTITISVDREAARAYEAASADEKRKLDLLLSLKLAEATKGERSLEDVMQEVSRRAQRRGLTPEVLKTLLDEQ